MHILFRNLNINAYNQHLPTIMLINQTPLHIYWKPSFFTFKQIEKEK